MLRLIAISFIGFLFLSCENKEVKLELAKGTSSEAAKYCFFGDAGTGGEDQKRVAKLLAQEDCQAYFYLGDIVYPNGIESAQDPKIKKYFLDIYQPLYTKNHLFLMMGNHDYRGNMDAWIEVAKAYPNLHYPAHYYLARINGICFPVINTTDSKIPQAYWLGKLDLSDCRFSILLGHHPATSSGKHKKPYFPLNLFLDYAVSFSKIYIAGHDHHLSYEGVYKGTHQFVSGAGGQLRGLNKDIPVWGESQLGFLTMLERDNALEFIFVGLGEDGRRETLFVKKIPLDSLVKD